MRLVINKCFGGFSLSRKAVAKIAEWQGRPSYFFRHDFTNSLGTRWLSAEEPIEGKRDLFWAAFDIPNPNDILEYGRWQDMTIEERQAHNELYAKHSLEQRPDNRADPLLIRVVEELGSEASGACAELAIVEIPDGIEWEIDEYDGVEEIHEKHRSWR